MSFRKIKLSVTGLLSALILQFFIFQFIQMSMQPTDNWYFSLIIKVKFFFNSILGSLGFSLGDILYGILFVLFLYWLIRAFIFLIKKNRNKAMPYFINILLTINILYAFFMFSFGLFYRYNHFPDYKNTEQGLYVNDLKAVATQLLKDCIRLREEVNTNQFGEFFVNKEQIIDSLYWEQSAFYDIPKQKPNVKTSLFSPLMRKIGVVGYYNPFTGEAHIVEGYPDTSIPFTIAHEMGHQVGIAPEDEANFYSFYMGEASPNKNFQYSVKYKAIIYVIREIYPSDSVFVNNILKDFSPGMKKDREREKRFYETMSGVGSDIFSYMNDAYLRSNNQEGLIAYNNVSKMIVNFYKINYPFIFENNEKFESLFLEK